MMSKSGSGDQECPAPEVVTIWQRKEESWMHGSYSDTFYTHNKGYKLYMYHWASWHSYAWLNGNGKGKPF